MRESDDAATEEAGAGTTAAPSRRSARRVPVWAALVLGGVLSVVVFRVMQVHEERRLRQVFQLLAQERAALVRRHMEGILSDIEAFRGVNIEFAEFPRFARRWTERHPGVRALHWAQKVPAEGRADIEQRMGRYIPGFTFLEPDATQGLGVAGERAEYFPTLVRYPEGEGGPPMGLDQAVVPENLAAMERALETALPACSPPLPRAHDAGTDPVVRMFVPLFGGREPAQSAGRRDLLTGYVIAELAVDDLLSAALAGFTTPELAVYLIDRSPPETVVLARQPDPPLAGTSAPALDAAPAGERTWHAQTPVVAGGRDWALLSVAAPGFFRMRQSREALIALAAGLLTTVVLAGYLFHLTRRSELVEQLVVARTRELRAANRALSEERALLERRVAERTEELSQSNQELEAFCYSVSHDLRAPLRAMDGFSRMVIEDAGAHLGDEVKRRLEVIRRNARQMGALIDDLLAFSRLSRQPMKREVVDLAALVRESLEGVVAGERRGGDLEVVIGDLPQASGDAALLRQALVNLLSNAVKYSRTRERPRVEFGAAPGDQGPIYFVKDNGVGFDMKYADKLFGVFQRLHRSEEYEGTGIGLALVQRIVRRHGGGIWAEARPDQGATFFFTLGGNGHA